MRVLTRCVVRISRGGLTSHDRIMLGYILLAEPIGPSPDTNASRGCLLRLEQVARGEDIPHFFWPMPPLGEGPAPMDVGEAAGAGPLEVVGHAAVLHPPVGGGEQGGEEVLAS
jgi:hypothetical protein